MTVYQPIPFCLSLGGIAIIESQIALYDFNSHLVGGTAERGL